MAKSASFQKTWIIVSLALIVLAGFGYLAASFMREEVYVPKEFFEARGRGAAIADEIVRLSDESVKNLRAIREQNEGKNYSDGLELVLQEVRRNELARENALDLSAELTVMAGKISEVSPEKASGVGLEAILQSSQIVQRLINYNNHIYQLLDMFSNRFIKGASVSDYAVYDLLLKMNGEIEAINKLNSTYKESMAEFDRLTAER